MSERKVLNKYYPPEFDPAKIPKLKLAKERQYTVRIMAPFNMQCKVCNEYIYKGKKFNAKTENVHNENYLGLRIYRFYIRCPRCISEVVFKTDPQQTDYTLEQGAIRLFEAAKLYQAAEEKEKKQAEEDATNPMKVLENRTKDSKLEMEVMENLEELRELNMRQGTINYEEILKQGAEQEALGLKQQEEDDEEEIRRLFGKGGDGIIIKRLDDDDDAEDDESPSISKPSPSSTTFKRPTDILTDEVGGPSGAKKQKLADTSSRSSTKSSTKSSSRSFLSGLVKVKKSDSSSSKQDQDNVTSSTETSPSQTTKLVETKSDTATDAATLTTKAVEAESDTATDAALLTTKQVEAESHTATDAAPLSIGGNGEIEKRTDSAAESDQNSESHSENSDGNNTTAKKEEEEEKEKEEKEKEKKKEKTEEEKQEEAEASFASSIQEGLKKQKVASQKVAKEKSSGLSLLGGYDFSDSDISDSSSDS
ncbi:splicing factor YJU2 [Strongylocentrotus purpuratus]|uniref:Splicing factor YJU2 n=1 Tax=Strongylocentrotus purpuratus TaxID=7668 RepID=A0A7M7RHY6_STRPU|nr:splicing factor YJU2 [Strongylocentrotus purpuratus]|eukprot:XP_800239.3 PREDICTED: coiled-coil domain-containing protein 94 [Strongylocentrotus purpuratus]